LYACICWRPSYGCCGGRSGDHSTDARHVTRVTAPWRGGAGCRAEADVGCAPNVHSGCKTSTRFLGGADNRVPKLPAESSTWVELPPSGLFQPWAVAADTAGRVYVTAPADNRVLKLPAESSTRVELPPSGLFQPWAVAADTAGRRGAHMTWRRRPCDAVVVGRSEVLAAADSLSDMLPAVRRTPNGSPHRSRGRGARARRPASRRADRS